MKNKNIERVSNFLLLQEEVLEKDIAIKITSNKGSTVLISEKIWNHYIDLVNQINLVDFNDNTFTKVISKELQDFVKKNTNLKEVYFEF